MKKIQLLELLLFVGISLGFVACEDNEMYEWGGGEDEKTIQCKAGEMLCDGQWCLPIDPSLPSCGACDDRVGVPAGTYTDCGNYCAWVSASDNSNCAGCGDVCPQGQMCTQGTCVEDARNPSIHNVSVTYSEGCGPTSGISTNAFGGEDVTCSFSQAYGDSVNCTATVTYEYSPGWTFDLKGVTASGDSNPGPSGSGNATFTTSMGGVTSSDSRQFATAESWSITLDENQFTSPPCGATSSTFVLSLDGKVVNGDTIPPFALHTFDMEIDYRRCE